MRLVRRLALAVVIVIASAGAARAQDRFEIQVYDVETAPHGEAGLEVHANDTFVQDAPDELHLTFEPHYGLADWAELGGYLQTALDTSGSGGYGGVKLRLKLRYPRRLWNEHLGLAVNGEVSAIPSRYEAQVWGSELRPVADLSIDRVYASVNPILTFDLRGDLAGKPQLEPAAKIAVRVADAVQIGAEAYGAFGPLDDLGRERVTRLLAAIDVHGAWWDLNAGAGPAWGSPDRGVIKVIVGFHPRVTASR
jgi:hypothetical protein